MQTDAQWVSDMLRSLQGSLGFGDVSFSPSLTPMVVNHHAEGGE